MQLFQDSAGDSLAQASLDRGSSEINQDEVNQGRCWHWDTELVDTRSTQKLKIGRYSSSSFQADCQKQESK